MLPGTTVVQYSAMKFNDNTMFSKDVSVSLELVATVIFRYLQHVSEYVQIFVRHNCFLFSN